MQLKACLEDKGYNVMVDPYDYHLTFQVGDERRAAELPGDLAECRNGIDPSRDPALPQPTQSSDQLRALYLYYVAQADCLTVAGYPGLSAPPEQVFIDSGGGDWYPRNPEDDIPPDVVRTCEQVPGRPAFLDW